MIDLLDASIQTRVTFVLVSPDSLIILQIQLKSLEEFVLLSRTNVSMDRTGMFVFQRENRVNVQIFIAANMIAQN